MKQKKSKVITAISGGVDSALTAFLLKEKGYEVMGLFMNLGNDNYEDEMHARMICEKLGVKFYSINLSAFFKDKIIKYFLESYQSGTTPNPCVKCNRLIKFGKLLQYAEKFDAKLATGHYVRVAEKNGVYKLFRGLDKSKDQSYFLYNLNQDILSKVIFPLGQMKKEDVKKKVSKIGLPHKKGESQDVCFLNKNGKIVDHNEYLKKNLKLKKGLIKTLDGRFVGEHAGLPLYTTGQRKGVEVGGTGPFYVVSMNYKDNELNVSNNPYEPLLYHKEIRSRKIHWISGREPSLPCDFQVVIRYRHKPVSCRVYKTENGAYRLELREEQRAVTRGQSFVLYDGDEVLGGGIID